MDEPTLDAKIEIAKNERRTWVNTRYQQQLRYKVNKSIGSDEPVLKRIEAELMKCEAAIEALDGELKSLEEQKVIET